MLQKPFNLSIRGKTIDANETNEVTWQVSGDIQTAYKIDISLNLDNSLVWTSNKITSYSLKHTLPVAVIANGNEYKITVTIWNQSGSSVTSDSEIFQTSSRPLVTVSQLGTVNSFSFNFQGNYTQSENTPLRNYTVNLYDDKKNLIDKSNIKTILPMEHLFSNLQTEKQYYIEFQATSSKGLTGTSGLILFDVFYYRPKMGIALQGKNIDNAGIELSWFVRQVIGETEGVPVYINNEKADLTNGNQVKFYDGFEINTSFSFKIWIESPYMSNVFEKVNLITLYGENGQISLQYYDDHKFHVWKKVNGITSHWSSDVTQGNSYIVLIQQINDDINITSEVIA